MINSSSCFTFFRCLLALLFVTSILFLFPGKYLITMGIVGAFIGNSGFQGGLFKHLQKLFYFCNFHTIFIITTGQLYLIMVTFHLFFFLVFRRTVTQFQLLLQQFKQNLYSQKHWLSQMNTLSKSSQKSLIVRLDSAENDYDDEWVSILY